MEGRWPMCPAHIHVSLHCPPASPLSCHLCMQCPTVKGRQLLPRTGTQLVYLPFMLCLTVKGRQLHHYLQLLQSQQQPSRILLYFTAWQYIDFMVILASGALVCEHKLYRLYGYSMLNGECFVSQVAVLVRDWGSPSGDKEGGGCCPHWWYEFTQLRLKK